MLQVFVYFIGCKNKKNQKPQHFKILQFTGLIEQHSITKGSFTKLPKGLTGAVN